MKTFLIVTAFTFSCFGIAFVASKSIVEEEFNQSVGSSENSYVLKPMERFFKISEVKSLVFETANADLEIIVKEDLKDTIQISYQELYSKNKDSELYYPIINEQIDNGVLKIAFESTKEKQTTRDHIKFKKTNEFPYFSLMILSADSKIKIYVPSGFNFETLNLEIVNGDIRVPKLNLDNLSIELVNGDVKLSQIESKKLTVEVVNGDIKIDRLNTDSVELNTVSGDIGLDGISLNHDYKIETVNGDVTVSSLDALNSNLNISSLTGDIEIDGESYSDSVVKNSETSKSNFKIDVTTGDVNFKTNQKL